MLTAINSFVLEEDGTATLMFRARTGVRGEIVPPPTSLSKRSMMARRFRWKTAFCF